MDSGIEKNFNYTGQRHSILSNLSKLLENEITDISINVLNERTKNKEQISYSSQKTIMSIKALSDDIIKVKQEKAKVDELLLNYQNENEQLTMELDRNEKELFHKEVEICYLKKKNQEIQENINEIKKTTRDATYEHYVLNSEIDNIKRKAKNYSANIEKLINDKKSLTTAIVIMNKKLTQLKQKIVKEIYKGKIFLDDFGKLVRKEKNEMKTNQ